MQVYSDVFEQIVSVENLFAAWEEFVFDKHGKIDVQEFSFHLEENLFRLHRDLKNKRYKHGSYSGFYICDPKVRHIHKATVRDRVLHHAVFRILNPIFEPTFIAHSFSCRVGKGTHKGVEALEKMLRRESKNYRHQAYALKCDVRKFFDSIDQSILMQVMQRRIKDGKTLWLLKEIIKSFSVGQERERERERESKNAVGLPIGNLTSQLFANVYMNELDQYVKHELSVKSYVRYTDDFIVVSPNREYLQDLLPKIREFLADALHLELHPNKISIQTVGQGVDFLGYVLFPHHKLLRPETRRRIFRKLKRQMNSFHQGKVNEYSLEQSLQSYLGVLSHADAYELGNELRNQYWFQK